MRIEKRNPVFCGELLKIRRWPDIRSENRVLGNGSTKVCFIGEIRFRIIILFQNGRFDYSSNLWFSKYLYFHHSSYLRFVGPEQARTYISPLFILLRKKMVTSPSGDLIFYSPSPGHTKSDFSARKFNNIKKVKKSRHSKKLTFKMKLPSNLSPSFQATVSTMSRM